MSKKKYLYSSIIKSIKGKGFSCPSCGSQKSVLVARKYIFTTLRRCSNCQLMFRAPTTSPEENASFYQKEYQQGFTTDCPSDEILKKYIDEKFKGSTRDYSKYIDVIFSAGGREKDKLFDFGCSWGYGSWQLSQAGFDVTSYEISIPRANYAREKLGLNLVSSLDDVPGHYFDVFFSSHVIEHVPSVSEMIEFGLHILKPGGLLILFSPNGSEASKKRIGEKKWNKLWGFVHPNFLDDIFYKKYFFDKDYLITSSPYDSNIITNWANNPSKAEGDLSGDELLIIVKK